jgi:two-component system, NtrC family, sensor histidine kinase KinB
MVTTLRTKLLIGVAPLVAIMVALGLWAVVMFSRLGNNIDKILKENYRSVLAAEGMKESIERVDSAYLFAIGNEEERARVQFDANRKNFEKHFQIEMGNVTLPGEQQAADALAALRTHYFTLGDEFFAIPTGKKEERTKLYFARLLPTFDEIKREANAVLDMNQKNMEDERDRASKAALVSIRLMIVGVLGAAVVAAGITFQLSRSILEPISAATRCARALARGDLDQVVPVVTRDELGELAVAFNTMARTIREYRLAGTARLLRAQQTAQATIDSFPDPVVVVDTSSAVERANPAARRILGVAPGTDAEAAVPWSPPAALQAPIDEVLSGGHDSIPTGLDTAWCVRDEGSERFFLPRVLAIRGQEGLLGAAVVLSDVTKFRLVDQLKSDMVSTVSHELKTPLTSLQMAVHLLLEEVVGPLNAKQIELLLAARQDAERLLTLVNDLLDLTRIEQGRLRLNRSAVAVGSLVAEAVERAAVRAVDVGVALETEIANALPAVEVDRERLGHVFDNLIGNALRHTPRGGQVRVSARSEGDVVRLTVADNGEGIAAEHLPHLFEKFYRAPGARNLGGAGLGLAISHEVVAAHGGQIAVTSKPGAGAVFTFTLPAVANHEPVS